MLLFLSSTFRNVIESRMYLLQDESLQLHNVSVPLDGFDSLRLRFDKTAEEVCQVSDLELFGWCLEMRRFPMDTCAAQSIFRRSRRWRERCFNVSLKLKFPT